MKNKLISLVIALTFLCSNFIFVSAITPSAKIELNSYSYTINSLQDVKISGTISKAYGQKLIVKNSNNTPILLNDLPNANGSSANLEFTIKSSRLTEGTNTFQVQSSNLMGKISASNPKTLTITYKKQNKQNQVITVSDKTVEVGKTINLNATVNSGLQLSYFSKNADIATVDGKGVVTGKKEGTVVIEISQNGNDKWNSVKKEVKVTVTKAAVVVVKKNQTITASNKSVKVGKSISLGAKTSSGLKLTYKSSNTSIATVDANGKVTGKKAGKVTISINQAGNNNYKSSSKNITIQVGKNTQTITTDFDTFIFYDTGKDYVKNIAGKASSKLKCTYKSSNTSVATVDKNGKITPKKPGTAKITITQKGNTSYNKATKTVIIKVPKIRDRKSALQPWYKALEKQRNAQNKNHTIYDWYPNSGPTLKSSIKYGTCITFPSAALMRVGLLNDGQYITPQDGNDWNSSLKNKSIKFIKSHPGYFSYKNNNDRLKSSVNSGKILPGDIIFTNVHTLVFHDKKNGKYYIQEAGRWKSMTYNYAHIDTASNDYIGWIVRINCYNVKTTCKNGSITMSNKYMAGQTVKITYKPNKGKTIKKIRIDGKDLSKAQMKKYKNGYTFNKLNKNHYVNVIFG